MLDHTLTTIDEKSYLKFYIETEKELILKYASEENDTIPNNPHNIECLEEKIKKQVEDLNPSEKNFLLHHLHIFRTLEITNLALLLGRFGYAIYTKAYSVSSLNELLWFLVSHGLFLGISITILKKIESWCHVWQEELEDTLKYQLFYQNEEIFKEINSSLTYNSLHNVPYQELKRVLTQQKENPSQIDKHKRIW